ncbi:MAG: putative hydroxymethylpyrimidine transport system substrate-binding protein [Solirubrobacterales bacterium]|jgi:putative hydroxymethylpyrimidine transport system substrate-binding protein|nr:putative hydroxymethylpyrimidine transport system substrate-binding protein [Solirubrobacterales bacterium]
MPRKSTSIALAAAALIAALPLAACGEKSEKLSPTTQAIDVSLDYAPNADHIGIYQALAKGYFKEAGLDVRLHTPSDTSSPLKEAAAGRVDLAITYEPEIFIAREQGLEVQAVGALVNRPLTSLISLPKAKIATAADLSGKRIANAGLAFQTGFLDAILNQAGVPAGDVKQVDVQQGLLPAIISGKADAIFGGYPNVEGVSLERRKLKPQIATADKLGVPTYNELVFATATKGVEADPKRIQLFLAALARGTKDALKSPAAGIAELGRQEGVLDAKLLGPEVKATLPYLERAGGKPFGYMDPRQWQDFAGWMRDNAIIQNLPKAADAFTNDHLPGRIR